MKENLSSLLQANKTELEEYIKKYEYLNKTHKDLTNSIKENIDATNNFFKKNGGVIENIHMMASSTSQDMIALNQAMSEQIEVVKKVNEAIEKMSNKYNVSKDVVAETLPLLEERARLQEKINEMGDPNLLSDDKIDEWIQFSDEIQNLEKEIGKLGIAAERMKSDFDKGDESIRGGIQLRKELEGVTTKVTTAQTQYNKSLQDAVDGAEKFKKSGLFEILSTGWNVLKNVVSKGANKWLEIDQMTHDFGRNMGMSAKEMASHSQGITKNYGDMASRLGMEVKDIYKFQTGYTEATEKAVILTHEQVESMVHLSRNVGDQAINVASKNLDVFTTSADATIEYLAKGTARAAMEGLNVKKYSEAFANNIKMASKYTFKEGINGIQKMTLMSQRLKFNMESIGAAMDKFSTIQGAIEASAKIQVLGGAFAQNFGNPLEAMSEALLDAEGFTKRIINTVAAQARFDSKTGEIDLAPIDKQRLKTMSEALGISYDELHNMATQSRKEGIINAQLQGNNLNDETKSYLINKAQYNKATGKWHLTDASGQKLEKDISQMTQEEINDVAKKDTYEKLLQSDVHEIYEILKGKGKSELSKLEDVKGFEEKIATGIADIFNGLPSMLQYVVAALSASYLFKGIGGLASNLLGRAGNSGFNFLAKGKGLGGMLGKTSVGRSMRKTNVLKKQLGRKIGFSTNTNAVRAVTNSKVATNFSKGLKFIKGGGALAAVVGAVEGYSAYKDYKSQKEEILKEKNVSTQQKAQALNDAKKERNKGYGSAIGGVAGFAAGAKLGATLGMFGGPLGMIAGTVIGGAVGYIGSKIGGAIGESMTEDVKETIKEVRKGESDGLDDSNSSIYDSVEKNDDINVIVSKIEKSVLGIDEKIGIMKSYVARISDIYNESLYGNDIVIKNKKTQSIINVSDMKVNVDGQIKLVSDMTTNSLDMSKLFSSLEFKEKIIKMVQDAMSKEPGGRSNPK